MNSVKYISIKSILQDLSTLLPEEEWDENVFLE